MHRQRVRWGRATNPLHLGCPWSVHAPPLEAHGLHIAYSWTTHGLLVVYPHATCELPLETHGLSRSWVIYDLRFRRLCGIHGTYAGNVWDAHGMTTGYPWELRGQPMGFP